MPPTRFTITELQKILRSFDLEVGCSLYDLKRSYLMKLKVLHPDLRGGASVDNEQFHRVKEAYEKAETMLSLYISQKKREAGFQYSKPVHPHPKQEEGYYRKARPYTDKTHRYEYTHASPTNDKDTYNEYTHKYWTNSKLFYKNYRGTGYEKKNEYSSSETTPPLHMKVGFQNYKMKLLSGVLGFLVLKHYFRSNVDPAMYNQLAEQSEVDFSNVPPNRELTQSEFNRNIVEAASAIDTATHSSSNANKPPVKMEQQHSLTEKQNKSFYQTRYVTRKIAGTTKDVTQEKPSTSTMSNDAPYQEEARYIDGHGGRCSASSGSGSSGTTEFENGIQPLRRHSGNKILPPWQHKRGVS